MKSKLVALNQSNKREIISQELVEVGLERKETSNKEHPIVGILGPYTFTRCSEYWRICSDIPLEVVLKAREGNSFRQDILISGANEKVLPEELEDAVPGEIHQEGPQYKWAQKRYVKGVFDKWVFPFVYIRSLPALKYFVQILKTHQTP